MWVVAIMTITRTNHLGNHEGKPNVDRIVNTKTDGKDDIDTGYNVDGDVPEVEEAHDVCEGDDDNADDVDADADVGKEQEGDNSDSSHGKTNVPPELKTNDFVGFPGSVDLAVEST